MPSLETPIRIRNFSVKNRVVLAPLVIFDLHKDGHVNNAVLDHYESFARGGCGILVQEATCVLPEGRLGGSQLGLWEDERVDGMKRIAERVIPYGPLLLMQIHYASTQGEPGPVTFVGPSAYENADGIHRALGIGEVERIRDAFVAAALRAEKAGYHGVELHGCHGFLLCAFQNARYNRRDDRYGDPTFLTREIIEGIRQSAHKDFIITCRTGIDNPDVAAGIAACKALEAAGLDMLSASLGMGREGNLPVPEGFPFSDLAWLGCEVRKNVQIPVIAVGGMNQPENATKLISEGWADFAAIGRGLLADPDWANKVFSGQSVTRCYKCKAGCLWGDKPEKCPARKKAARG